MNLNGYAMSLDSLINREIFLLAVHAALIILIVFLVWFLPYFDGRIQKKKRKPKTNRKAKIEKKKKRNTLIVQTVFTVIAIVVGIFGMKIDAERLSALKTDADSNSISVYEGEVYLQMNNIYTFSRLFVDYRAVTFEGSDEIFWIDMAKTEEGWIDYSGYFNGKIMYGENSKVILKVE